MGTDLVCVAVEGWKLVSPDVAGLRAEARRAQAEGAAAVFLADGPLGDPIVLAAGLSACTSTLLLGVEIGLEQVPHRHPAVLGRDLTTLDHLCPGRAILTFTPPFDEAVREAIGICRDMWVQGTATSEGPAYPVPGAINRPRPASEHGPLIALDLTRGDSPPPPDDMVGLVDLLLHPTADEAVCRLERR